MQNVKYSRSGHGLFNDRHYGINIFFQQDSTVIHSAKVINNRMNEIASRLNSRRHGPYIAIRLGISGASFQDVHRIDEGCLKRGTS